jgi:myo-inositol-1(or 4)-monophosphatase
LLNTAIELAREAGASLLTTFGKEVAIGTKGDNSNVVTAADTRSEALIVQGIRKSFPRHSIIAEEAGCDLRECEYTWVIDPLDGTSNFAAGIPWFGVLICVLRGKVPIAGVLYTPVNGDLYAAESGAGAYKNGERISVTQEESLANVLWAYGMDGGSSDIEAERNVGTLARLLRRVRNVRATNSLVDAAYTADGRLGGMLNQSTRIWDIAAPMLLVQEAGGSYTDLYGNDLELDVSPTASSMEYAVLAGSKALHSEVAEIVRVSSARQA